MRTWLGTVAGLTLVVLGVLGPSATAEQASSGTRSFQAGTLDAGAEHTCAVTAARAVRCWGQAGNGQLGYGNTDDLGDTEPASTGGDVPLGGTAVAVSAGSFHTCALLSTGAVRCWGFAGDGRLGYGNTTDIGDTEPASTPGDVPLGGTATAITAGDAHTCALMSTGAVRCWGRATNGRLGYGNTTDIGDTEPASTPGDVPLGGTAVAITAGNSHTCALMSTGAVRCWGFGTVGQLGYGNSDDIGDTEPASAAGDVPVGGTAVAVSAGTGHTCAVLTTGAVRCWGTGGNGRLGYGNTTPIGDSEPASAAGDVPVGGTATAVTAGGGHTCALLTTGAVRCWGAGSSGRLGYGTIVSYGDTEPAGDGGDVSLDGIAAAVTAGNLHTCALLTTNALRCWGEGDTGRLGYGTLDDIGDTELPSSVGTVPVGASLPGLVADLGLGVAAPPTAVSGRPFTVTTTVTNGGVDDAPAVVVTAPTPPGTTLDTAAPSTGSYVASSGQWQVGALAAGAQATLTLTVRRETPGPVLATAEVTSSGAFDRDSTPDNAAAGEDDRATSTTDVAAPTPSPSATPVPVGTPVPQPQGTPGTSPTRVKGRLAVAARPRPGRRTLAVTGTLTLPAGADRGACSGRVRLTVRDARRATLGTRVVQLRRPSSGRTCRLGGTLKLRRALAARAKLTLSATVFAGPRLSAVSAARRLTVPRR